MTRKKKTKQNQSLKINDHVTSTLQFVLKCDLFRVLCNGNLLLRLLVMFESAFRPSFKSEPLSKKFFRIVKLNELDFGFTTAG